MKVLRFFLYLLAFVAFLVVIAVLVALVPDVQTAYVQHLLDQEHPGLTVDGVLIRPHLVSLDNLKGTLNGARVTIPHVEASVSLYDAVINHKVVLDTLVAKGWTVDFTKPKAKPGVKGAPAASSEAAPTAEQDAQAGLKAVTGLLHKLTIPCDGIDGTDVEGDIIFANPFGVGTSRIHITASGSGLHPGGSADISFSVTTGVTSATAEMTEVGLQGEVLVNEAMDHSATSLHSRVDVSVRGPLVPDGRTFTLIIDVNHKDTEVYTVQWRRDDRTIVTATGSLTDASPRVSGTWTGTFTDQDMAFLEVKSAMPTFTATGKGTFDSGEAFAQWRVAGQLAGPLTGTDKIGYGLPALPPMHVDMGFDAGYAGGVIHVASFTANIAGDRPILVARSLKPFDWDTSAGAVKVGTDDWIGVKVTGLPVSWLPTMPAGLALKGDDSSGEFTVRRGDSGITLVSKTPWITKNASIVKDGIVVIPNVELNGTLKIDVSLGGWKAEAKPLKVLSNGVEVASANMTLTPIIDQSQPATLAGSWTANVPWLSQLPILGRFGVLPGVSASGDFSWTLGVQVYGEGNLKIQGKDDQHLLTASLNAGVDEYGRLQFKVPVKITEGDANFDVEIAGTWSHVDTGYRIEVNLDGDSMNERDLRRLVTPFAALAKVTIPDYPLVASSPSATKDAVPFWGTWTGTIHYAFSRFAASTGPLINVRGVVIVDNQSLSLNGAQWIEGISHPATLDAKIYFNSALDRPYTLSGKGTLADQDAATIFAQANGDDPLLEGKFSVETSYAGDGLNLSDLVSHSSQSIHYTSKVGIIRLLKVNVADAVPEVATPVRDTVNDVGNVAGLLFGAHNVGNGHNKVQKKAQTVIDFTNEIPEIGYDSLTVTVVRSVDGAIRLDGIDVLAPNAHLVGSGKLASAPGRPIKQQPLSLDLTMGFKGRAADLLKEAGITTGKTDEAGYALIDTPVHFGGTIAALDNKGWHDLLYKAAAPAPAPASATAQK